MADPPDLQGALQVAEALSEIRQVKDWLSRPSAATLTACEPALERAVSSIQELSHRLEAGSEHASPHLKTSTMELAGEIQEVQTLLAAAARLYLGRVHQL